MSALIGKDEIMKEFVLDVLKKRRADCLSAIHKADKKGSANEARIARINFDQILGAIAWATSCMDVLDGVIAERDELRMRNEALTVESHHAVERQAVAEETIRLLDNFGGPDMVRRVAAEEAQNFKLRRALKMALEIMEREHERIHAGKLGVFAGSPIAIAREALGENNQ